MSSELYAVEIVLDDYLESFYHHGNRKYAKTVLNIFENLKELSDERMKFALQSLKEAGYIKPNLMVRDVKCSERAVEERLAGNAAFAERKYTLALQHYTKSLCHAPLCSKEMALAYGNRSAVLYHVQLYVECAMDVERALVLQSKLLNESLVSKYTKRMNDAHQKIHTNSIPQRRRCESIPLIDRRNPAIECAADCVQICERTLSGRGVYASCDIPIGTVISIEKPYCVYTEEPYRCHNCLKVCHNPVACHDCTYMIFCDDMCRTEASVLYHCQGIECRLMHTLRNIIKCNKMQMLALRLFFSSYHLFHGMLGNNVLSVNCAADGVYHSGRYEEIHNLETNASKRSVKEQFRRTLEAAYLFNIIEESCPEMMKTDEIRRVARICLPHYMQIVATNFHSINELVLECPGDGIMFDDNLTKIRHIADGGYSFASLFNHACVPNVTRFYFGTTMVIRTIAPIKNGTQLVDNYGYHFATTNREVRRTALRNQYHFKCECCACVDAWPLYKHLAWISEKNRTLVMEQDGELCHQPTVETILKLLPELVHSLEVFYKVDGGRNGEFFSTQEVLKKCFTLEANKRFLIEP